MKLDIQTTWIALALISAASALSPPSCQTIAPAEKNLTTVTSSFAQVPAKPFGLVYSHEKDIAFVALNESLGVLNTSDFTPRLIHRVALPMQYLNDSVYYELDDVIEGATGITLTHDGRFVLVTASSTQLIVIDAAKAATGDSDALVGALNGTTAGGNSAIEVVVTRDGKFAFVTQEDGSAETGYTRGNLEVFSLDLPGHGDRSLSGTSIGYLELEEDPVGLAFSPDERYLYVTTELNSTANESVPTGMLNVIDVEIAKITPNASLVSQAVAGCGAVRVIVSESGDVVWVTARESNYLVAFNASRLITNPDDALIATVQVGIAPVGLTFAKNGTRILTADSNRFATTPGGVSVVDVQAALRGDNATLGQIASGVFPREIELSPDGKVVLMSVYGSEEVQVIDVSTLP